MPDFSVIIPATPFLRQRIAGLSGIARDVILADLAGAHSITIVADAPVEPDWQASFNARERPLPRIVITAQQPEVGVMLPADALPTADGLAFLCSHPGAILRPGDPRQFTGTNAQAMTMAMLRATLKPTEGWVGRHLNRPISFRISALLLRFGIGPDPVTWFTLALAIVMALVLAHGGAGWLAVGGLLYQAVSVIDCIDGDIARVTYRSSRRGALLDTACDMVANLGFYLGLTTGVVRTYGVQHATVAVLLVSAIVVGVMAMSLLLRLGPRRGSFDVLRAALTMRLRHHPRLQGATLAFEKLFKRDFYVLLACVLCLAGLAWTVPPVMLGGAVLWLGAMAWCAPLIVADKQGALLPPHLRTI